MYAERALLPDPAARRRRAAARRRARASRPTRSSRSRSVTIDTPLPSGRAAQGPRRGLRRLLARRRRRRRRSPTSPIELGITVELGGPDRAARTATRSPARSRCCSTPTTSTATATGRCSNASSRSPRSRSSRRSAREDLEHRAYHDELTGLPNRALLNDRLDARAAALAARRDRGRRAVPRPRPLQARQRQPRPRRRRPAAHARSRSACSTGCARPTPSRRLGGDEFVVVVEDVKDDLEIHAAVAARRRRSSKQPFEVDARDDVREREHRRVASRATRPTPPTCCARPTTRCTAPSSAAGAASSTRPTASTPNVDQPRSRASPTCTARSSATSWSCYYQPIVDIALAPCRSRLEALVRWNHPELGLVPPGDFIPLAEDTGLIVPLGWRVLEHALRRLHAPARPQRSR